MKFVILTGEWLDSRPEKRTDLVRMVFSLAKENEWAIIAQKGGHI